ncbi:hypothetical protein AKO1_007941 [Acrasis kona]|uniref:EGF-like domain-containing protein n=1 Tax=Acrasis kona TaxID=1008807 RepID=A0AAW2YNY7_9EUKA
MVKLSFILLATCFLLSYCQRESRHHYNIGPNITVDGSYQIGAFNATTFSFYEENGAIFYVSVIYFKFGSPASESNYDLRADSFIDLADIFDYDILPTTTNRIIYYQMRTIPDAEIGNYISEMKYSTTLYENVPLVMNSTINTEKLTPVDNTYFVYAQVDDVSSFILYTEKYNSPLWNVGYGDAYQSETKAFVYKKDQSKNGILNIYMRANTTVGFYTNVDSIPVKEISAVQSELLLVVPSEKVRFNMVFSQNTVPTLQTALSIGLGISCVNLDNSITFERNSTKSRTSTGAEINLEKFFAPTPQNFSCDMTVYSGLTAPQVIPVNLYNKNIEIQQVDRIIEVKTQQLLSKKTLYFSFPIIPVNNKREFTYELLLEMRTAYTGATFELSMIFSGRVAFTTTKFQGRAIITGNGQPLRVEVTYYYDPRWRGLDDKIKLTLDELTTAPTPTPTPTVLPTLPVEPTVIPTSTPTMTRIPTSTSRPTPTRPTTATFAPTQTPKPTTTSPPTPAPRIVCYGIISTDRSVCSYNGKCVSYNNCVCDIAYIGKQCEKNVKSSSLSVNSLTSKQEASISSYMTPKSASISNINYNNSMQLTFNAEQSNSQSVCLAAYIQHYVVIKVTC